MGLTALAGRAAVVVLGSESLDPAEGNPTLVSLPRPPRHVVKFCRCQNIIQLAAKAV